MKTRSFLSVSLFTAAVLLNALCRAGTGTAVDSTPRYLNLNLFYNYTPADLEVMKNAFQEASRLLFNSTNGQLYIATVRVSTDTAFQNKADVWVNSGASGAYSNVAGLGTPGWHSTLFENRHRWTNEDGPDHNERGQFGIVHEFGHYVFDLYDEYAVSSGGYPGAYCVSGTSTVACIMDGGTQIHPQHHRTEWCTPHAGGLTTAHVTTPLTPQQDIHGVSCWETIASYCSSAYGITLTAPAAVQTADPAGLPAINWVRIGNNLRLVIALDRSYSMSVANKEPLAKQAAALFTDLCRNDSGEFLGVVSFSNTAVSDFPIQSVTTAANTKANAVVAINGIALENMTALGDGLRRSYNEITGGGTVAPADSAAEAIVLLSDGVNNFGAELPVAVLPDLRNRGVRIFSIGLGQPTDPVYPLDEPTLLDLSNQTGGKYTHATAADQLATIYADYAAEIRGMSSYPEDSAEMVRGRPREHKIEVDKYTREQVFLVHWPFGAKALLVTLKRPDGTVVSPIAASVRFSEQEHHVFYRVSKPVPGTWTMIVEQNPRAKLEQKTIKYSVQALADAPGLSFAVAPQVKVGPLGRLVVLRATVYAGGIPVTGAEVAGTVESPDGERARIALFDDGDRKSHADAIARDGIYSAVFGNTKTAGTYKVVLTVRNRRGVGATPDEIEKDWKPARMAPFVRKATASFQVGEIQIRIPKTEKGK